MSRLRDKALQLAARGMFVFPLGRRGKKPLISKADGGNGFHDATRDTAQIELWWTNNPSANIGIATGTSGLVVVDVDGPEGQVLLKQVSGGDIPWTYAVKTGREGGFHLYYLGTDVPSTQDRGDHLDIRGTTGYVLSEGSIHPNGTEYEAVADRPMVHRPEWIRPWVGGRTAAGKGSKGSKASASSEFIPGPRPSYVRPETVSLAPRGFEAIGSDEIRYSRNNVQRLRAALKFVPPDIDGKTWYTIGAVLHDLKWVVDGIDHGFDLFDEYSARSKGQGPGNGEYRGRADIEKRWVSFAKEYKGVKATLATVYAIAIDHGWDQIVPEEMPKVNGVHALPPQFAEPNSGTTDGFIVFPDRNKNKILATCRNTRVAIQALGLTCEHDLFHDKLRIGGKPIADWAGDLTDNAVHMLRVVIEQRFHFDPGTLHAYDATVQECLQNSYDPVQDYLDDLRWDGTPRLDQWMPRYLGADATLFNCAISRLSLMAAVRRVRQPGCKFDQIIVLEGPEGRGKSSAIEILAGPDNFSDQTILGLDDRAQQEAVQGTWLYEIADLARHSKSEVEGTKAFITRTRDRARPAYGRSRVDRPRRCVFFATTNNDTYLKSQTGNRRFWPVRCERIELEALARDRDQLWAEAAHRECAANGMGILLPEKLWRDASTLQDSRRDEDPWEDTLATVETIYAKTPVPAPGGKHMERRITSRDILELVLKLPIERQTDVTAKRVAFAMRRLGWDGPKLIRVGEQMGRGYVKATGERL